MLLCEQENEMLESGQQEGRLQMPIYEYQCESCEARSEHIEKMSADSTRDCPQCAGKMKRQISRTNFKLVGSGWYATDYKTGDKTYTNPDGHKWRQEPVD